MCHLGNFKTSVSLVDRNLIYFRVKSKDVEIDVMLHAKIYISILSHNYEFFYGKYEWWKCENEIISAKTKIFNNN